MASRRVAWRRRHRAHGVALAAARRTAGAASASGATAAPRAPPPPPRPPPPARRGAACAASPRARARSRRRRTDEGGVASHRGGEAGRGGCEGRGGCGRRRGRQACARACGAWGVGRGAWARLQRVVEPPLQPRVAVARQVELDLKARAALGRLAQARLQRVGLREPPHDQPAVGRTPRVRRRLRVARARRPVARPHRRRAARAASDAAACTSAIRLPAATAEPARAAWRQTGAARGPRCALGTAARCARRRGELVSSVVHVVLLVGVDLAHELLDLTQQRAVAQRAL